jgi:hypothetical protein
VFCSFSISVIATKYKPHVLPQKSQSLNNLINN